MHSFGRTEPRFQKISKKRIGSREGGGGVLTDVGPPVAVPDLERSRVVLNLQVPLALGERGSEQQHHDESLLQHQSKNGFHKH